MWTNSNSNGNVGQAFSEPKPEKNANLWRKVKEDLVVDEDDMRNKLSIPPAIRNAFQQVFWGGAIVC